MLGASNQGISFRERALVELRTVDEASPGRLEADGKSELPSSHPFHSDVRLELVFIPDFHVLFHVIR